MSNRRRPCATLLLAVSAAFGCAQVAAGQPFGVTQAQPERLAGLVVGAGADNAVGGFAGAFLVVGGTHPHPDYRIWEVDPFALSERFQVPAGALTAFGLAAGSPDLGPLGVLAALRWGDDRDVWALRDTTKVQPIPSVLFAGIKDGAGIPPADSFDAELEAYFAFLEAAHWTPQAVLEKAARRDVSYAHLFQEPKTHRGQVVELVGQLRRIRRFAAPASARNVGIPYLYEGWIFHKTLGGNPFCVLFTELPPGFRAAEELDVPVKFVGYFYKKYRYTPADQPPGQTNYKREAPLLVGRTLVPPGAGSLPAMPDEETGPKENWAKQFLPIFVGGIFATLVGVFALLIWTRRTDAALQKRIAAARDRELELPAPDEEPAPTARSDSV